MSTIIKAVPKPHATKRTTGVWILDDGRIGTRVEDPVGTKTDKEFNFSSYAEGSFEQIDNEPVVSVSSQKLGTDARFIITVDEFYNSGLEGDAVPKQRYLWYEYNIDEKDAPADNAPQSATPSTPIYVIWSSGGTPASPTLPIATTTQTVTLQRQWAKLGSLDNRRQYLRRLVVDQIEHPNYPQWATFNTVAFGGDALDEVVDLQKIAMLSYFPEMLARAISVDANLNTEAKFNLLEGMANLNLGELVANINNAMVVAISNRTRDSERWSFYRIGNVGSAAPFAYTRGDWTHVDHSTTITMTGSSSIGTDWQAWLRS